MTAVPKRKMTAAEYLEIERKAAFKSEFYNGEMFAMAGASEPHNRVKENLVGELFGRMKGGPCGSYSSDQRVLVDRTGLYTYPDIVIVCGEPAFASEDRSTITNPQVVIEVMSDSTETYDRGTKFRHYRQISSLQVYVLVAQDEARVEQFVRQPDGTWNLQIFADPAGNFTLAKVGATVPLADVYRNVTFPPPEPLR
ncbi:Uma2 family endonuclease [Limnoglobus roseus]|uniref:Putative restriction endonuclease domain-containing protein n=1 Tax=Limnoglobus roseus TaxID=2598579 RepID=A0A5C1AAU0_9BACT|nr:Uma2 family endonuclease [Limnoglobus roseus]QEL15840.1 hypothetical protein PX52LOC_02776 [Limnoglobus roseus]